MGAVAGQERALAAATSDDGAHDFGYRDGKQGQSDQPRRDGDADTPGVREKHAHGRTEEIGATVPEIDPGRRAIGPQERGQGTSQRGGHETGRAMKDEGEADGGRGADAGRQHVEPVKQVEAVDQHDTRDHHERDADPTREMDRHCHGDDRSHAELGRKSQAVPEARSGRR